MIDFLKIIHGLINLTRLCLDLCIGLEKVKLNRTLNFPYLPCSYFIYVLNTSSSSLHRKQHMFFAAFVPECIKKIRTVLFWSCFQIKFVTFVFIHTSYTHT